MRTSSRRARVALVASLGLLLVGAAGCGGGDDDPSAQRCVDEARNAAEAAVVADYYERGELGPKAEIRRQLSLDGRDYFEPDGSMRPYAELSSEERTFLVLWFTNDDHVDSLTYDDRQEALEDLDPDC